MQLAGVIGWLYLLILILITILVLTITKIVHQKHSTEIKILKQNNEILEILKDFCNNKTKR